jgi:hypothetical protein
MSRALNLNASQADVLAMCSTHSAAISCIEGLVSGGTRVVLRTAHDAAVIARVYGAKVITGPTTRIPSKLRHAPAPAAVPPRFGQRREN